MKPRNTHNNLGNDVIMTACVHEVYDLSHVFICPNYNLSNDINQTRYKKDRLNLCIT